LEENKAERKRRKNPFERLVNCRLRLSYRLPDQPSNELNCKQWIRVQCPNYYD